MDMERFFLVVGVALLAFMIPVLMRAVMGPTAIDRIVAVNIIGTKAAVLLVFIGTIFKREEMFVDFSLAYALLNFIGSLAAARYFHRVRQEAGAEGGAPGHGKEGA
ncbi:MAG: monovalent cation/H+ antiporter complex subunit F [Verrucomicrobiales bacterium]